MNITSKIVALSSAVAFGLQIAFALLILRYFSPEEVGMFSVISQTAFFWASLCLAQAPLRLLTNQGDSIARYAKEEWFSSAKRYLFLLPIAAFMLWWCDLPLIDGLLWSCALSLCQFTWLMAQSLRMRMIEKNQVWVRLSPPLISLVSVCIAVGLQLKGSTLLASALLGYAVGSLWFLPTFFEKVTLAQTANSELVMNKTHKTPFADDRPGSLRVAHTFVDCLLATSVVVVWQRLYGAQETGWMAAPLRVLGFVPAVIHVAWAQVQLAQPQSVSLIKPIWVGLAGFFCVSVMALGGAVLISIRWLDASWQGVLPNLLPLVVWQGCACITAAYSHFPFQSNQARLHTLACMIVALVQSVVLITPYVFGIVVNSHLHLLGFSLVSAIALLALSLWQSKLNPLKL